MGKLQFQQRGEKSLDEKVLNFLDLIKISVCPNKKRVEGIR